jgi:uncharacterized BrkB/YihY/UPF0761 family membrane protein
VEVVVAAFVILLVFGFGPVMAMLDVLSRELARDGPGEVDLLRIAKGILVLWIPFAWIYYFLFLRRRAPFAE